MTEKEKNEESNEIPAAPIPLIPEFGESGEYRYQFYVTYFSIQDPHIRPLAVVLIMRCLDI